MDDYLGYYCCQSEATPKCLSQLVQFREFFAKKRESTSKKLSFFLFLARLSI